MAQFTHRIMSNLWWENKENLQSLTAVMLDLSNEVKPDLNLQQQCYRGKEC